MIIAKVERIKGSCIVFKKGDKIVINGPEIDLKNTTKICIHALQSILHYAVALENGIKPSDLGIGNDKYAYVQCLDPGKPYTKGGTVIFKCWKE